MKKLLVCLLALIMLMLPALAEDTLTISGVVFSSDGKTLIQYPAECEDTHYTVPDGVEVIGEAAFCGAEYLVQVTLPDSVYTIADYGFADCHALESIRLPERMRHIGDMAFYQTNLKTIDLPEGIPSIGWLAFAGANLTGTVIIPEGVTEIGTEAFVHQRHLLDLYLPSTLETIHGQPIGADHGFWDIWGGNNWHDQDYQLVLHAPEGTLAAQFARQSGQGYVIEDARCATDRAAAAAWVQSWLDAELPGAQVGISRIDLPAVAYSADTVLAAVQLPDGKLILLCFDRTENVLAFRWRNDDLLSQAQTWEWFPGEGYRWTGGYVPHVMALRGDELEISVQFRADQSLRMRFACREGQWELSGLFLLEDNGEYWHTPVLLGLTEDMLASGILLETYAPDMLD